jgi:activator-of-BECN1-regulated-autophagy protein 1
MKTVNIISDQEDEVNIAQFHPQAGFGILYGTKKAKVRVFQPSTLAKFSDMSI